MQTTQTRYTKVAIYLHWVLALLMIYMVFFGEGLIRNVKGTYYPSMHASLGVAILVLSIARLGWRLMNPPPAEPPMPAWQAMASRATHWLFYILMIGLPISGMAAFDHKLTRDPEIAGATVFGITPVPHFSMGWLGSLHDVGSKVVIFLLLIHVGAALKHQFWDKDNLLKRMSPH
jgi:cytochrome b561